MIIWLIGLFVLFLQAVRIKTKKICVKYYYYLSCLFLYQ